MNPELVSIICGIIAFSIYMMFFSEEPLDSDIAKRLKETKEKKFTAARNNDELFDQLKSKNDSKLNNMLKDSSDYRLAFLGIFFRKFEFTNKIKKLLKIADLKIPIDFFFIITGGLFLPFFLISIISKSFLFILLGIGAAAIPYGVIKMKIDKNLQQFNFYFPDTLGLISNSLKAGHSLLSSFQLVSTESPYPINKLFKNIADDISLGRDIREALEDLTNNIPGSEDAKFFITAVLIQKEIGGNLAEILDTLNNTIRERFKLIGMIKTQTSQAKISGLVLALAPIFITLLVSLLNPSYMTPLFNTFPGHVALAIAIGMSAMGYIIINKITQIRV
ncbi:MAG: type II secretion system F family protein [bacterium]